jgi:homoserine/homoserine lactone efflux protein
MISGIVLGNLIAMIFSFAGIGTLFLTYPTLYDVIKLVGATYLVYLGVQMWAKTGKPIQTNKDSISKQPTLQAFWVTVLNPRSFFFFVSFMPQFISKREPFYYQILILGLTFLSLVIFTGIIYIIVADRVSQFLNNNFQKWIYRIGAINLIVTGIAVLDLKHF